jgi:predicted permease
VAGVRSAALSLMTPMGEWAVSRTISAEGYRPAPDDRLGILANSVTEDYFATLGIPLLLGRDFRPREEPAVTSGGNTLAALSRMSGQFKDEPAAGAGVCIVNESLARHLFGDASPLGRHLSFEDKYDPARAMEIVGVVKDVHHMTVRRSDLRGIIYVPSWSQGAEARMLSVRVSGDAAPVIAAVRRQVHEIDANVPVLRVRTLEEYVNASFQRERLIACLCAVFGVLALGLASVGLYGVMAYAVTERTREIGVRIALGAQRGDVIGMVLRESLLPVLAGIAAGLCGALSLVRLVAGMLYGVAPHDPFTIVLAAVAMLGVSLAAAVIPARRASRVEPMTALRYE